jgi:DNA-binding PadR family transcriptional regulator
MSRRRLGTSTLAILRALADGHRYGFDMMDATGLPGGTVYPALAKLENDKLVSSRWEDPAVAHREKRPPRRYYDLSAAGAERLQTEIAWLAGAMGTTAPAGS